MSCSVAKLALPITRFSIIRPATATVMRERLELLVRLRAVRACRSAASASRRKSFGKAWPCARSAASFAAALGDDLVLVDRRRRATGSVLSMTWGGSRIVIRPRRRAASARGSRVVKSCARATTCAGAPSSSAGTVDAIATARIPARRAASMPSGASSNTRHSRRGGADALPRRAGRGRARACRGRRRARRRPRRRNRCIASPPSANAMLSGSPAVAQARRTPAAFASRANALKPAISRNSGAKSSR